MAEIKPMALIESMKKKVCEHSDVYFRTNKKTGKVYTGKLCNPSTKEPSADEQAQRTRFATVARMVQARKQDLTKIAGDLAAFNAQKDNANGKKTMRSYLWMVCDAELG
jgi:hypothetical protein